MKNFDDRDELLEEIGVGDEERADYREILKTLEEHPEARSLVDPPAFYESHLLNALRESLPNTIEKKSSWGQNPFRSLGFSWSMASLSLILFLVFFIRFLGESPREVALQDIFLSTVEKAPAEVVDLWLASTGSGGTSHRHKSPLPLGLNAEEAALVEEMLQNYP